KNAVKIPIAYVCQYTANRKTNKQKIQNAVR
ncbi:uncharacterized protein METZ01_LOCUS246972, partial [marine metagenome]